MMIITPQKLKKVVKKIIQKKNSYSKKTALSCSFSINDQLLSLFPITKMKYPRQNT